MFSTAIALGNFDGLHLGHLEVLKTMNFYANEYNIKPLVIYFSPHPYTFFKKEVFKAILPENEKHCLLQDLGYADLAFPFNNHLISMGIKYFVQKVLVGIMNCKVLVINENFQFGADTNSIEKLKPIAKESKVELIIVPHYIYDDITVRASYVKKLINERNFPLANKLMSCPYFASGTVINGKKLGRSLGFPTANIKAPADKYLPPNGVYVTKTLFNGDLYPSVTNIGLNPTVNGQSKTIETYILDFSQDLYGKDITVYFHKWIRDEISFSSLELLMEQITKDENCAREYFNSN